MPQPGELQRAKSKFIVFEQFEKLNTKNLRQALSEKELAWLENLQPIAPNQLLCVPAPAAAPLATIAQTITSMFYADIGGTDYLFGFTSAGSGWSINVSSGATVKFAPDATFSSAPDLTVWQASRVLINDTTAGYCTYDGTLFAKQGGVSPVITVTSTGFGYSGAPAVTISGGSGSGATAVAVLTGNMVTGVTLTAPGTGYLATDILVVTFGTGAGSGATATANMSGSPVGSVTITNTGTYTTFNVTVAFSGGGGSGAAGTPQLLALGGGLYAVVGVTMTNQGSGYTSPPTATFSASAITTATGVSVLVGQSVSSVTVNAAGSGYLAAPGVVFSGGGGSNAAAHTTLVGAPPSGVSTVVVDAGGNGYQTAPTVTITTGQGAAASAHVWPFIPKGATLAVFQGRVWLAGNQLLQYTGTQGYDDFLAGNASGSLTISDADLVHQITALRSVNNYLFILGDQSVKQIGNISLSANGLSTLFTILTLSSDQGTIWPRSCGSYNRVFMFANPNGIYAIFGASVQKISDDLDGIWKIIDTSQQPQIVITDINSIHNVAMLVRYIDPLSTTRSILLTFDGKRWYVLAQGDGLKAAATAPILATGTNKTFGSSGTDVTQLLANAAGTVTFKAQSALTHHGNALQRKKVIRAGFSSQDGGAGNNLTVAVDTELGTQSYTRTTALGFQSPPGFSADGAGRYLGMTVTGTLSGFALTDMLLEYQETALWG